MTPLFEKSWLRPCKMVQELDGLLGTTENKSSKWSQVARAGLEPATRTRDHRIASPRKVRDLGAGHVIVTVCSELLNLECRYETVRVQR